MLEVVGVTGVVHMGQIQSGLRSANRIAQGGHVSCFFIYSSQSFSSFSMSNYHRFFSSYSCSVSIACNK